MLDRRVKQRLEALGYAVEANVHGYFVAHHGQMLETGGTMCENHPDTNGIPGWDDVTWANMGWEAALLHSKKYYLVLTSLRLGNRYDVHRGGVLLPCRVGLSYAGAMVFVRQEQAAGRCVQVVTQQINGTLHMEETEA